MPTWAIVYLSFYLLVALVGSAVTYSDRTTFIEWLCELVIHVSIVYLALAFWHPGLVGGVAQWVLVVWFAGAIIWEPFAMIREARQTGGLEPADRRSQIQNGIAILIVVAPAYIIAGMRVFG